MEELKKKTKKNKLILVIIGILIILLLSGGIYYFVSLKNDNSDNDNNVQNNTDNNQNDSNQSNITYSYDGTYRNDNGKEITLIEHDYGRIELISGKTKFTPEEPYDDTLKIIVLSNADNWYLLNREEKKILAYYEDKDVEVTYESFNDIDYYFVGNEGKIVLVANELGETILSFNNNYPEGYSVSEDFIYIKKDNSFMRYDSTGKLIETKMYDNILNFSYDWGNYGYVGLKNGSYYFVDITNNKEVKMELKKIDTYKGKEGNLEVYSFSNYVNLSGSNLDYSKIYLYNNNFYARILDDTVAGENYEYEGITVDPIINYAGQCNIGDFIINVKTKELVDFSNSHGNIHKVSSGYYFTSHGCYTDIPDNYADMITTSKGKTLEGKGRYSIDGDHLTIGNKNSLLKYDVTGKVIQKLECDKIYIIDEKYALVKKDSKYFLIDLTNNFSKKEVTITDNVKLDGYDTWGIYKLTDKEVYFDNYSYNFDTQELKEIFDYDE